MAVLAWRYDKAAFRWIWARGLEMETWRFFTSNFYETLEHFVWGEGEERDRDTFAQQTLKKSLIYLQFKAFTMFLCCQIVCWL